MTVTYTLKETFDGTRTETLPDPDNEGQTKDVTTTGIKDIIVEFTKGSIVHTRNVNVVFTDGSYDDALTKARCEEVALGVENKIAVGLIS